jgi:hypothetical protein
MKLMSKHPPAIEDISLVEVYLLKCDLIAVQPGSHVVFSVEGYNGMPVPRAMQPDELAKANLRAAHCECRKYMKQVLLAGHLGGSPQEK